MQSATVVAPFLGPEHAAFRDTVRRFVRHEITPFANDWDEAETFPRELYGKAAAIGLLGLGFPEEHGGVPADVFFHLVASEELAASGCGGVSASLMSHSIGAPPIAKFGSPELQRRVRLEDHCKA